MPRPKNIDNMSIDQLRDVLKEIVNPELLEKENCGDFGMRVVDILRDKNIITASQHKNLCEEY